MKHILDVVFSSILLLIFAPIFIFISIAIAIDTRGPIIFRQQRVGKNGSPFTMYKFRSMVEGAQSQGNGLYCFKNDPRVTRIGAFIRKTSIDELPQLINVIKGDMAILGPRPPVVNGFPGYETLSEEYKRRFLILPGISGLAQVVGRNELSWDKKVYYDNLYIDNLIKYGILYDLKILCLTIKRVLKMNNVEERFEIQLENQKYIQKYNDKDMDS